MQRLCRFCGAPTSGRFCGSAECLAMMARGVVSRRAWAGRFLFLALLLGTATGLFIAFFHIQRWQDDVLRWAFEHHQYEIGVAVVTRSWRGVSWHQWSAVGITGTGMLLFVWLAISIGVAIQVRSVPYLRGAVREAESERWGVLKIVGALALVPVVIALLGIFAGAAAASGGHHHDASDIDGL